VKSINDIRKDLINGNFVHSVHSAERVIERNISALEIAQIGKNAVIIEDYPDDKISPSCLIPGYTDNGKPLHLLLTRDEEFEMKIITIYEPDPAKWQNNLKDRREK
jgi:hypothetical protein